MASRHANASATGTVLSAASWLDDHFEACREAYAAIVERASIPQGARVLDLGAGTGVFTSLLRTAIGSSGEIVAFDLDPANLAGVPAFDTEASAVSGSALALPFRDDSFDAVWSANLTQYLSDEDLGVLLQEAVRVTRPGGLVAVKDVDMATWRMHPGGAFLGAHLAEACATTPPVAPESVGSIRGRELRAWLQQAGLSRVSQQTFPIEYLGPLEGAALRLWSAWLPYLAGLAEAKKVPEEDLATWRRVADVEAAAAFVQREDFYGCELQVLAVGRIPSRTSSRWTGKDEGTGDVGATP